MTASVTLANKVLELCGQSRPRVRLSSSVTTLSKTLVSGIVAKELTVLHYDDSTEGNFESFYDSKLPSVANIRDKNFANIRDTNRTLEVATKVTPRCLKLL